MSERALPALTAERRAAIVEMAAQRGAVRVSELATRFDVDVSTIRRDLQALERQDRLQRVHGGALPLRKASSERAGGSVVTQEARIGRAAAKMVGDGETIFLGPGQLPLEVARYLSEPLRLTVVTNGLDAAHWIAANTAHTLIVTGGQVEAGDRGLMGQLTRNALSKLRADRVILELDGISAVGGLTSDDLAQAEIAQALLEIGSEVIVLVPAERVGRVAAAYIAAVSEVDVVVTGREAPSSFLWDLSETGVRVVLA
ncbi:MAG: DeoR/GlpR transcriptional regulator [Anaerolineae bacterium]|nr:DeoR/GlpR transcriptional regulator [Anaerolineae bacterium]